MSVWLLAKVCGHSPERLTGVAAVPMQDVGRAVAHWDSVFPGTVEAVRSLGLSEPSLARALGGIAARLHGLHR